MIKNKMGVYGNIWFRMYTLNKGETIPCHSHKHQHITLVGNGSAMALIDDKEAGIFTKGEACPVEKEVSHGFIALEDNTTLTCIHAIRKLGEVDPADWDECLRLPKHAPEGLEIHPNFFEEELN